MRRTRILIIAGFGVFVFLGISLMLARALSATGTERSKVPEIAEAQARGDAQAVLAPHPGVRPGARLRRRHRRVRGRLKRPGDVEILQYRPCVQLPLTNAVGTGRVAWRAGRTGCRSSSACACAATDRCRGATVELLSISAPIGREASCPP